MRFPIPFNPALESARLSAFWPVMPSLRGSLFLAAAVLVALSASVSVARADLLVLQPGGGGRGPGSVFRFDENSGAPLARFGEANEGFRALCAGPAGSGEVLVSANVLGYCDVLGFDVAGHARGPVAGGFTTEFVAMTTAADGTLYAVIADYTTVPATHRIVRQRAGSGYVPETFIAAGTGGMQAPRDLAFAADGTLCVADAAVGVLRFDGASGAFVGVLVPAGRGGLRDATRIVFGPEHRLYIASGEDAAVLRFDAATGAFIDTFVAAASGGLAQPQGLAFGPQGDLFVASGGTHQVLRFEGRTGKFRGVFASDPALRNPSWLVFASLAEEAKHAQ